MTLKQSNNIFIVLSGKNFYATLDSQGKYHFLYFGLLGRFKICPSYLIDGRPHYPTAKQNYKNQFYTYGIESIHLNKKYLWSMES